MRISTIAKQLNISRNQVIYLIRKHHLTPTAANPNRYDLNDFGSLRPYPHKKQRTHDHVQSNVANSHR